MSHRHRPVRDRLHYFRKHVGARGAMLLVLSAVWARLFLYPTVIGRTVVQDANLFYYEWPIELRIGAWVITILAAASAAFVAPRKDAYGWTALAIMPAQRMFAWGFEFLADWRRGDPSWVQSLDQLLLYALIICVVLCAAAMRPPLPYSQLHPHGGRGATRHERGGKA